MMPHGHPSGLTRDWLKTGFQKRSSSKFASFNGPPKKDKSNLSKFVPLVASDRSVRSDALSS